MVRQKYTATITKINARHYSRINHSARCAKMSLWAETDMGDEIWLTTEKGLSTRRIEKKVAEMEREYGFMVGQKVDYIIKGDWRGPIGFLYPRGTSPESYRPKEAERYENIGEGI
jgi:hypothetical protein